MVSNIDKELRCYKILSVWVVEDYNDVNKPTGSAERWQVTWKEAPSSNIDKKIRFYKTLPVWVVVVYFDSPFFKSR